MNFADALAANTSPIGRPCGLCTAVDKRDDAGELWTAIEGDMYSLTVVRRALADVGVDIGVEAVRRHRLGECRARGLR